MPLEYNPANEGFKILYVEDSADSRLLVKRILSAEGYQVLEAASAQQALEVVAGQTPDLILMDIHMPDMDGYTLTQKLRARPGTKRTPIIALTALALKGDRERSLEAGCDEYIQKPIDVDRLPRLIRRFLAHKR